MNTSETVQSVQDRLRVKRLLLIERWIDEEIAKPRTLATFIPGDWGQLSPEERNAALLDQLGAEQDRLRDSVTGVSPLHESAKPPPQFAEDFKALDWLGASLLRRVQALEELSSKAADGETLGKVAQRVQALETALQVKQVAYEVTARPWATVAATRLDWTIDSQHLVLDGQHMIPWDVIDAKRKERDETMAAYEKQRGAKAATRAP